MLSKYFKFGDISPVKYFFYFGLFLVILFSSIGENNDFQHPLRVILQWSLQVFLPLILLVYLHIGLQTFKRFDQLNAWLKLLIAGFLGASLFSPFAFLIDVYLGSDALPNSRLGWLTAVFNELTNIILPITASWIAMNSPWVLGLGFIRSEDESSKQVAETSERVEQNQSISQLNTTQTEHAFFDIAIGDILYLKAEQHYIRIVTMHQSKLVLFNLKDAISRFPVNFGIQLHRSYWVALKHVIDIKSQQGQHWVLMPNQILLPISRRNMNSVRLAIKEHKKTLLS